MILEVFSNLHDSVIPSIFVAGLLILLVPTLGTIWFPALCFAKAVQRRVQVVVFGALSALGNTWYFSGKPTKSPQSRLFIWKISNQTMSLTKQ